MTYDNFERDEDFLTDGCDPRFLITTAIEQSKNIQICNLKFETLATIIQSDPAGRKYLRLAEPFLIRDFATNAIDELGRTVYTLPDLATLPVVSIVDYVLGLKYYVEFSDCCIGIDVAINYESAGKKLRQQRELKSVYSRSIFDKIAILIVDKEWDSQILESQLKTVVESKEIIQIIDL